MAVSKTTKTTAKKPTTTKSTAAKAADKDAVMKAAAEAAKPAVRKTVKVMPKEPAALEGAAPEAQAAKPRQKFTKEDFVSAVAERSGTKRGEAKPVVEAALEVLGEAIAAGRMLKLPGLGKVKVARTRKLTGETVFVTRIRRPDAAPMTEGGKPGKDPLAEAAE